MVFAWKVMLGGAVATAAAIVSILTSGPGLNLGFLLFGIVILVLGVWFSRIEARQHAPPEPEPDEHAVFVDPELR